MVLSPFTPVASNSFSFPSLRSSYTAVTLSSTCFWIFLPSRIQSGEETDVGRQRFNHSSLSLSRFSELNKALDTNEYNWTTNSVRLILSSQYPLCENYIKRAPPLWGLKQVFGTNLIPLKTKLVTQTKGVPAWPVINQLWFPERHFSANCISLRLGKVQMKFFEKLLQALLFSAPRGFAARARVLVRLVSLAQIGELARRLDIFERHWYHRNIISMFCFRSLGRSVNHSGHFQCNSFSKFSPATCNLQITPPPPKQKVKKDHLMAGYLLSYVRHVFLEKKKTVYFFK